MNRQEFLNKRKKFLNAEIDRKKYNETIRPEVEEMMRIFDEEIISIVGRIENLKNRGWNKYKPLFRRPNENK